MINSPRFLVHDSETNNERVYNFNITYVLKLKKKNIRDVLVATWK